MKKTMYAQRIANVCWAVGTGQVPLQRVCVSAKCFFLLPGCTVYTTKKRWVDAFGTFYKYIAIYGIYSANDENSQ